MQRMINIVLSAEGLCRVKSKIILANNMDVLPGLADESFDLCLTDPPYNISNEVTISRGSQGKYKGTDISSDFGEWDAFESDRVYLEFTNLWCEECARVLKPGGFFISFFDKEKITFLYNILKAQGLRTRDNIVWIKNNPVPQVRKVKFAQATEMAAVLSKEGPNRFQWENGYHPNYKRVPIVGGHERLKDAEGKTLHMTQKPERIFRWLLDYFCEPGGAVLDPFSGTGTTAVVAIESGRQFMCMEAHEPYWQASKERIQGLQRDLIGVDYKSAEYKEKYL